VTVALDLTGRAERTTTHVTTARLTAVGLIGALVASIVLIRPIRLAEAMVSAGLLRLMGTGADRFGTAVLVETDAGRAGFTIATGCSTTLLAAPFLAVGALTLGTGRVRPARGLIALAWALVGISLLNQLRFAIVGGAIHLFGFERGYGQSHVLIGTLVSTTGLVVGLAGFVWLLVKTPKPTSTTAGA
jgi:exosortase/archaeosortase family protein